MVSRTSMYVCLCKAVTENDLIRELDDGARNLKDISKRLGVGTQCGTCACHAKEIIQDYKATSFMPDLAYAAG